MNQIYIEPENVEPERGFKELTYFGAPLRSPQTLGTLW